MIRSLPTPRFPYLAALDLGSNSFHLVVARQEEVGLHVVDRVREPVRLAAGLDKEGRLHPQVQERALAGIARIADRLRAYPGVLLRVVGTNTFRRAQDIEVFRGQVEKALGHEVEILSGIEEARLIYAGVSRLHPGELSRLVVDIGGGSTELVVGVGEKVRRAHSLFMGCVSYTERFFSDGQITRKAMRRASLAAGVELESIAEPLSRLGWQEVLGASGTIRAVARLGRAQSGDFAVTEPVLRWLEERMLSAGSTTALAELPTLREDRAAVLPGGVAILSALLRMLPVERIVPSLGALREGVLYDLDERLQHRDVRDQTVLRLQQTYSVDTTHAERVEQTALALVDQLPAESFSDLRSALSLLIWAVRVHEIGLAVSHAGSHKHAAYLLEHGDLPGFSAEDQHRLARLVRLHRRKIPRDLAPGTEERHSQDLQALIVLLRLAVLLCRARRTVPLPKLTLELDVEVPGGPRWKHLTLELPAGFVEEHPLTSSELEEERGWLAAGLAMELSVVVDGPATDAAP